MKSIQSKRLLNALRIIAVMEGLSFILLLFLAMPLKYFAGIPIWVRLIGMGHGILFMAYIPLALWVAIVFQWPIRKTSSALIASLIPFGTFWAEYKIFRA